MTPEKLKEWYGKASEKYGYTGSYETWLGERYRCQTDLFYLATEYLGYDLVDNFVCFAHRDNRLAWSSDPGQACPVCQKPLDWYSQTEGEMSIHRLVCDFFVHKNPAIHIFNQDSMKDRLLMIPRGGFKSSMNQADVVQWIICFPDIRIGLLTASEDLGESFVSKIKSFFQFQENETGTKNLTPFQKLFIEYAVSAKKKEEKDRFTVEARTKKITEPTLHAISLGSTTSGFHYDVGKYDDCVSNKNSGPGTSQESRDDVGRAIRLARSIIEPAGYHDNIGTPYDEQDAYSKQLDESRAANLPLKTLIRPCWTLKPQSVKKKPDELVEFDYKILFPFDGAGNQRLTYGYLRGAAVDPINFACQYLCQPEASRVVKFTKQMMEAHFIDNEQLPLTGYEVINAWDFAYVAASGRDYTVGVEAWIDRVRGLIYIKNVIRGRFSKSELAYQVAKLAHTSSAEKIAIEGTNGADFLENDIRSWLAKLGCGICPIEFFPVDTKKGAKEARAEGIETLLVMDRIFFVRTMGSILGELVDEFIKFKPSAKRKDDCVDAVAHACRYLPHAQETTAETETRNAIQWKIFQDKVHYERIYNRPDAPQPAPPPLPTHHEGMPLVCPRCQFAPCIC